MNSMHLLDPTRTQDRKTLCTISRKCRYHTRRCELARLRALRLTGIDTRPVPAIWESLRPARAKVLAYRAAFRMRQISMRHYDLYIKAANDFLGING